MSEKNFFNGTGDFCIVVSATVQTWTFGVKGNKIAQDGAGAILQKRVALFEGYLKVFWGAYQKNVFLKQLPNPTTAYLTSTMVAMVGTFMSSDFITI